MHINGSKAGEGVGVELAGEAVEELYEGGVEGEVGQEGEDLEVIHRLHDWLTYPNLDGYAIQRAEEVNARDVEFLE